MQLVITALSTALDGANGEIVYIPEGEHSINASVNGKAKTFISRLDPQNGNAIATEFSKQLDQLNAQNVRTFLDFDHEETGPASGLPKTFKYIKGKGLILELEWTGAGKKAIEAKDYSYFSPTVLMNEDGSPAGLPEQGPLGGLVNNPAFRTIERIAAAQAKIEPQTKTNTTTKTMSMQALVKAGVLSESEAAQDDAVTVAASRYNALKEDGVKLKAANEKITSLTSENQTLKNKITTHVEASAKALVEAAVKDGRLDPKDEANQKFWTQQLVNSPEDAQKALSSIQAKNADITKPVITASATQATGTHQLVVKARALVTAGVATDEEDGIAQVAEANPELYQEYSENLGN